MIQTWRGPAWRLMRRPRVLLCIAFLPAGIVAAAWAWRLLAPSSVTDKIALLNLFAVVATAMVVAWYSWETRKLRQVAHRQTALQIRPFLALEYGEDRQIWVHNLGKGVARDIRFHNARFSEGLGDAATVLTVEWQPIDFIAEGQKQQLHGIGEFVTAEARAAFSRRMTTWMATFGPHGSARYEFIVDYSDLTGTQYRAAFKVHLGHTELLRDAELEAQ